MVQAMVEFDVADDYDKVRPFPVTDLSRTWPLFCPSARRGCQSQPRDQCRGGQAQLLKKQAAHALVIVLASMDEELREQIRMFGECGDDRRHLHQVGPRADDVDDLHVRLSAARIAVVPTGMAAVASMIAAAPKPLDLNCSIRGRACAGQLSAARLDIRRFKYETHPMRSTISADDQGVHVNALSILLGHTGSSKVASARPRSSRGVASGLVDLQAEKVTRISTRGRHYLHFVSGMDIALDFCFD